MDANIMKKNIETGELSLDCVCNMLANVLDANVMLINLLEEEIKEDIGEEINGERRLEEFIFTNKGWLTGEPLFNYLKNKYVSIKKKRIDTLDSALKLIYGDSIYENKENTHS